MRSEDPGYLLVLTTTDTAELADTVARALVERQLAACVNIVGPVRSVYRWDEKLTVDEERLLVIKTSVALAERVRLAIRELHTYQVPEVLYVPVSGGDETYLRWLRAGLDPS